MRRALFCLALGLWLPGAALAQTSDAGTSTITDGGPPDGGSTGCGDITFEGECQGNVVAYCDVENDEVVMLDCEVEYGPEFICQRISPEYGVWCALALGVDCLFEDSGEILPYFCQGTEPGCVETLETSSCEANVGACTVDDVRTCRGQNLIYDCVETQPWLVDCESFLGSCEDDHCAVPAGVFCDDDVLICEDGLTCSLLGMCEQPQQPDAGVADTGASGLDAGTGGEEEDEGCGCVASHRERGAPYLLLIVAAWFIVRRRGR